MKIYSCLLSALLYAVLCAGQAPLSAAQSTCYFNADGPKLSVQSGVVRDGLRLLPRVPGLRGDNFLRAARAYGNSESAWKAPMGYTDTRVALKSCTAQLLRKDGTPHEKAVLLHGGGYILKLSNICRSMAARYSRLAGDADVFCPDCRLAPEHVFPAAPRHALDAWNWLLTQGYKPQNILAAGDGSAPAWL